MGRFQLVFRREGTPDSTEFRYCEGNGQPTLDGRLIVDGGVYLIHGVLWLVHRDDSGDFHLHREDRGTLPRFICTPVDEPEPDR